MTTIEQLVQQAYTQGAIRGIDLARDLVLKLATFASVSDKDMWRDLADSPAPNTLRSLQAAVERGEWDSRLVLPADLTDLAALTEGDIVLSAVEGYEAAQGGEERPVIHTEGSEQGMEGEVASPPAPRGVRMRGRS